MPKEIFRIATWITLLPTSIPIKTALVESVCKMNMGVRIQTCLNFIDTRLIEYTRMAMENNDLFRDFK